MKAVLILLIFLSLHADIKPDMLRLYEDKKYDKVCNMGYNNFAQNKQDEEFISLYAFGCLNADMLERLSAAVSILKLTKESRTNAAYFSVILMQKKLLLSALLDGYDLSAYRFPATNHLFSKIFEFYVKLPKGEAKSSYLFVDKENSKISYKLYLVKDAKGVYSIAVDELFDSALLKKHIY